MIQCRVRSCTVLPAGIGDDDGVGPEILTIFDCRAFRQEKFGSHSDLRSGVGNGAGTCGRSSGILKASYRKSPDGDQSPDRSWTAHP